MAFFAFRGASIRHFVREQEVAWSLMITRFKKSIKALCLLSAVVLLPGCSLFFGHDDQVQDPLTVKDQGLSCVLTVGSDVKAFFGGEDRDPVQIVDCLSSALTKFSDNTRGANPDGWTRSELSSFFETYFKEESSAEARAGKSSSQVQDGPSAARVIPFDGDWVAQARRRAVVTELFRWKASLLGGGETTLSRVEMNRIREFLKNARVPLAAWRGQGSILAMRTKFVGKPADITRLESLTSSIREVAALLSAEVSIEGNVSAGGRALLPREPMKLEVLASSLEHAGVKVLDSSDRQQLLQVVKSILLGGDPQQIAGDEWGELVRQSSELWIAALGVQYGILQNTSAYDRDLDFVETVVLDLTKSIERMVQRHGGLISNDQIRRLMVQLENNGMLPAMIRAKTVNGSLDVIFGKLLGGNSKPNVVELSKGLQLPQLVRIRDVVHDWTEGQRVALALLNSAQYVTIDRAKLAMSQIATTSKDNIGEDVRQQMTELVLRGRPLIHDSTGRLMIIPSDNIQGFQRSDLEELNLTRVLMSAAMQAYSHQTARAGAMPQITEAEIQELFMDLKALGRDLGIVDVRSLQSGVRTFMEANIFLSVSDGNEYISLHEMVEWFQTVIGAGRAADLIHADLLNETGPARCGTAPVDVFGRNRLKAQCFRENVLPVFRERLSHLPNFIKALDQAEREKKVPEFLKSLEGASRAMGASDLPIESSDVRVMSPVIHYVEALFARYDVNRSSQLETPEVWSVYPLIRPFIQKLATDSSGKPMTLNSAYERAIFSFLLEVGEPPTPSLWGKIELWGHRWTMWTVNEEASFRDVVNILASFQAVGRQKKNRDLVKYYADHAKAWEAGIASGDPDVMRTTRDLLQCAKEADADLLRLVQARRADNIFAVRLADSLEDQAKEFSNRFRAMVQADPNLQLLCLAF